MQIPGRSIHFNEEAQRNLLAGTRILAQAVGSTLGPGGRNVVFTRQGFRVIVTKDGVTVAREVHLNDLHQNQGVALLRDAAQRTAKEAGDGTTTSVVLGHEMFEKGLKLVAAGMNVNEIRRGMDLAVKDLTEFLRQQSAKVSTPEEIAAVATISANGDAEIGKLIADLMADLGEGGVVLMDDSLTDKTYSQIREGFHFDKGAISPYLLGPDGRCVLNNPVVVVLEGRLDFAQELTAIFKRINQKLAQEGNQPRPVLIVCETIRGEALNTLVQNLRDGRIQACVVPCPEFGLYRTRILQDLALAVGTEPWLKDAGSIVRFEHGGGVGDAARVVITQRDTFIEGGKGDPQKILGRLNVLKAELDQTSNEFDQDKIRRQMGRLSSGVGIIYVGGRSEAEVAERKARVEDAIHAARGAVAEGILPGGGSALTVAAENYLTCPSMYQHLSHDQQAGYLLVLRCCSGPLHRIASNVGADAAYIVAKVAEGGWGYGYNALTREFGNLLEQRVIDPTRVVVNALGNANSAATMLLTTGTSIVEDYRPMDNED